MSETNKKQHPPTLCWECAKATGGCRWSKRLRPIEGWKIIPTQKETYNGGYFKSCIVLECPEFVRDSYKYGLVRCKNNEEDVCSSKHQNGR